MCMPAQMLSPVWVINSDSFLSLISITVAEAGFAKRGGSEQAQIIFFKTIDIGPGFYIKAYTLNPPLHNTRGPILYDKTVIHKAIIVGYTFFTTTG